VGFLAPIVLIAAGALAIPLLLHLFHRHDTRRFSFPALRYLLRTEKEHARRIRFRQLLLLFLRLAIILLVVLAGARLFVRGSGSGHDPTAVVLILDNSMSSGAVVGEERVLDALKRVALETVSRATPDDRIWVIRAGEPWDAVPPGSAAEAAERITLTEVSAAHGDLVAALARARELLLSSALEAREIHLLSDLQGTAFGREEGNPAGDLPVIVYRPETDPPFNRYLHEVLVGGGLAPLAGQRTEIAVSVGATEVFDETEVPLRLVIDDQIRGASSAPAGRGVTLPIGPFPEGLVRGYVEIDPDALRADDRREFAFRVRPPPVAAVVGDEAFFLEQALTVLEDGGRLVRGSFAAADVLFSVAGEGLEARRGAQAVVVFPPGDPALLPAMNLRLAQAGVPWRLEPTAAGGGEAAAEAGLLPVDLSGVRVQRRYALEFAGGEPPADEVVARLSSGAPWIASGISSGGPYVLFGSPLDPEATSLPVSAAMVPLLEWLASRGSTPAAPLARVEAGQPLPLPPAATHVRTPEGETHPVDRAGGFRATRSAGIYTILADETVLELVPVVPPLRESLLGRLERRQLEARIGSGTRTADDLEAWGRAIFVTRQGPELWRPLLMLALLLLVVEAWVAAPGGSGGRKHVGAVGPEEGREIRVPAA
jgi:hypothetical protein